MYDKTVADLEDKLNEATMLLRFFKAHMFAQKKYSIEISDMAIQCVQGDEHLEVFRDDNGRSTIIKLLIPRK